MTGRDINVTRLTTLPPLPLSIRAAAILILDYRSGALGRISLETPALRASRQAELKAAGRLNENPNLATDEGND